MNEVWHGDSADLLCKVPDQSVTLTVTSPPYGSLRVYGGHDPPHGREFVPHPATFPSELVARHVRTWTEPGDLVLDPFAGSGTTLKVAKDMQRRYLGIEIHSEYLALIEERLRQEVLPFGEP